jgi:hypothetical protein
MTNFLHSTATHNVYSLDCQGCGVTGEIGVPKANRHGWNGNLIKHECGTLYVQKQARGMFGKPELVTVCETKIDGFGEAL